MSLSQKTSKKKRRAQAPSIVIQKPFEGDLLYKGGSKKVDTTIGDLICAIYDAANEISRNETLVNHLTEITLNDILKKKAQKKR